MCDFSSAFGRAILLQKQLVLGSKSRCHNLFINVSDNSPINNLYKQYCLYGFFYGETIKQ